MKRLLFMLLSIQFLLATSALPLTSGKAIDGTVKQKEKKYYSITVPKNKSLRVNLTELEADVDLYVKKGNEVRVRFNDCYSSNSHRANEECIVTNKGKSSIYTILVNGFRESSYNLKATIEEAEKIPTLGAIPIEDTVEHKAEKQYQFPAKKGKPITITLSDLTADADLRVKVGRKANLHTFDCKSTNGGTKTEECVITPKKDTTIYAHVYGYRAANYSINAVQDKVNPCITRNELNNKLLQHKDVTDVNTSCITDMSRLSYYMDWEFNQDLSNWDVSNVTNMEEMFAGGKDMGRNGRGIEINSVGDLSKWDVSKVTNMEAMFYGYYNDISSLRISNWDTSNVTNMKKMFYRPWNPKHIDLVDISKWNVENVKNHKDFFPKTVDNKQPKWRDENINSKLINKAKETCINNNIGTNTIACLPKKIAFMSIEEDNHNGDFITYLYRIDINRENVKLIEKSYSLLGYEPKLINLKGFPSIAKSVDHKYPHYSMLYFKNSNGKEQEGLDLRYEVIQEIKTSKNGKKLIIRYETDTDECRGHLLYENIYEMSTPLKMKLFSKKRLSNGC